jgi:deoxyribodipyrimidine photolyase-related protein
MGDAHAGLSADVGRARAPRIAMVLGDQLSADAAPLALLEKGRDVVLMVEADEEATHVPSHKQRTALFLSAMRHFAVGLRDAGHRVRYVRLDDPNNTGSFTGELERAARMLRPDEIHLTEPGEQRVAAMLEAWRADLDAEVVVHPDTHFLAGLDEFEDWAEGRKDLVLEYFYRKMRKDHRVLLTRDGKPVGGDWNFDKQNRKAFKRAPRVPERVVFEPDAITREVLALVERRFPDAPGSVESFGWAVTRDQALEALDHFIEHRLAGFGDYQDAMWTGQPWLFHAHLSPAFNLKLLDPREAIEAAVAALEAGEAPINSVEGFVRQLLGWREFIRGVYWQQGPGYRDRNHLGDTGDLPGFYWTGDTEMVCLRESIGQVVEHAYGHHIQRLMVTGNFAMIAGVDPAQVNDWYLAMFADAVDWVTTPNTIGMAMHADGGVVGTKPYAASGKYIQRMSNYCDTCPYDASKRTGDDACPFSTFYWDFLLRHEKRLRKNQRMGLVLKNLDRLSAADRRGIRSHAKTLRERMGVA